MAMGRLQIRGRSYFSLFNVKSERERERGRMVKEERYMKRKDD